MNLEVKLHTMIIRAFSIADLIKKIYKTMDIEI